MAQVKPIPEGYSTVTPHLVIGDAAKAIEFYKRAFGAEEVTRVPAPDGKRLMHAEVKIGNSRVMLADDFPEFCGGHSRDPKKLGASPVTIHLYVQDCDAAFDRAVAAGATVRMPIQDMFWGDRYGALADPFGHEWSIATHKQDLTPKQIVEGMKQAFS